MASISRTYTFSDGTSILPSKAESEFQNIVMAWNNHDQGIRSWTSIKLTNDMTITGAGKGVVVKTPDGLHTYRIAIDNLGSITTEQVT